MAEIMRAIVFRTVREVYEIRVPTEHDPFDEIDKAKGKAIEVDTVDIDIDDLAYYTVED